MSNHFTFPIIEKLGGRTALSKVLTRPHERRQTVTKVAIGLWVHRGSIPGFAVVQMMELARQRDVPVEPTDFARCAKPPRKSKKKEMKA